MIEERCLFPVVFHRVTERKGSSTAPSSESQGSTHCIQLSFEVLQAASSCCTFHCQFLCCSHYKGFVSSWFTASFFFTLGVLIILIPPLLPLLSRAMMCMCLACSCLGCSRAVVSNLWVATPLEVEEPFHWGHMSAILRIRYLHCDS